MSTECLAKNTTKPSFLTVKDAVFDGNGTALKNLLHFIIWDSEAILTKVIKMATVPGANTSASSKEYVPAVTRIVTSNLSLSIFQEYATVYLANNDRLDCRIR